MATLSSIITPTNLVTLTGTATLTNKTLTAPTIASANLTTALTLAGAAGTNGQVLTSAGSGLPSWTTVSAAVGDHEVYVTTGNGYGSTNTKIERFSVTQRNVGTAITYADSASLGASFTINSAGIYAVEYSCTVTGGSQYGGISVNSNQLTTGVASISASNRVAAAANNNAVDNRAFVATTLVLAANDVVRPHVDSSGGSYAFILTWFKIRKIGVAV
jgi:hypothetical protein